MCRYGWVRDRCYCSAHQNVAATTPNRESPRAACPIPRVMAVLSGPEVRVGNFSRHFQQNNTPSVVVSAPQRLHFRLMSLTPGCGDPDRPAPCPEPPVCPASGDPRPHGFGGFGGGVPPRATRQGTPSHRVPRLWPIGNRPVFPDRPTGLFPAAHMCRYGRVSELQMEGRSTDK
jgi:hypothetical protein